MKRWLRREVLMPLLFLVLYGGVLFLLARKLQQLHILLDTKNFMTWLLAVSVIIYVILIVTTISHITRAYLLERFDPGDPGSVRRMARKWRFHLPRRWDGNAFSIHFPLVLSNADFKLESGDRTSGQVFARSSVDFWTHRSVFDRVLLLETGIINVFRVDQLLKETIDQLDHIERPSKRNILIIAVRMANKKDVASAAAGCVNYMGRFQSGTLFPVLIDVNHHRCYYPINRSFIQRGHRSLQNYLLLLIRSAGLHRLELTPGESATRESAGASVPPTPARRPRLSTEPGAATDAPVLDTPSKTPTPIPGKPLNESDRLVHATGIDTADTMDLAEKLDFPDEIGTGNELKL